jgi:hypothetical protein
VAIVVRELRDDSAEPTFQRLPENRTSDGDLYTFKYLKINALISLTQKGWLIGPLLSEKFTYFV